ncbi:homoserine kinase [Tepidibacter formicigenes]|jgi:homoserine kinase|uniref:Homoserine kinase n=1 Tax=Tepidibacter formicigenes DSM 15518 TaxID=1123349 RepID=A0A1M6Q7U7_9FIRM|nr:homoserine kinase [Tepidibacter formicigenes]SHK16332.1 homoserine kinase [Tepidibacter formicigenes DSM 15518]
MIKVKVPATTANMGPGFDSLGMALNLYNEIEIEEVDYDIPIGDNLIYKTLAKVLNMYSYKYRGFRIKVSKCNIPICRGLGSSASCIVAGVVAANKIIGNKLSLDEIINMSTQIEGHPDNVVPAIIGGMVISIENENKVTYSKINLPKNLKFAVMIPEFEVRTQDARNVLPNRYLNKDCIFNISRVAMLVNALNNGELDKIRLSVQDKIHQPYRKNLIKNIDYIFDKSHKLGSKGEFISGSGSTVISIIDNNEELFVTKMKEYLKELDGNWNIKLLKPDLEGAKAI